MTDRQPPSGDQKRALLAGGLWVVGIGLVSIAGAILITARMPDPRGSDAHVSSGEPSAPLVPQSGILASGASLEVAIPPSELEGLYNPPTPARPSAVAARARELCNAQGTDERPITMTEINEMAVGQVAAYRAARNHGYQLTPDDERCLADAKQTVKDAQAERLAEVEADEGSSEP